MDEPVIYYRTSTVEEPVDLDQEIQCAIQLDDKDKFLKLIKEPGFENLRDVYTPYKLFRADALDIAIAVLNGETKGIIDLEDVLVDGMTPLHLAADSRAPRVTNYLLKRGDNVGALCDYESLKQATPLDLALHNILSYPEETSLFDLLFKLCHHRRDILEVLRLLVQNTSNKELVSQKLIQYSVKENLTVLGALFLAVPEMFLSKYLVSLGGGLCSFDMMYLASNSSEKKTPAEEGLSLLLDIFAMIGHKLVAYVRLQETRDHAVEQTLLEVGSLLREVDHKKLGVSSPDYYFRFFKPLRPNQHCCYDDRPLDDMISPEEHAGWMFLLLPDLLMRKDIDLAYIYWRLPTLEPEGRVIRAINKKLSSMPTVSRCHEHMSRMSKKEEKPQPQQPPFLPRRNFEHSTRSFSTSATSPKSRFDVKIPPTNSLVNNVTELKSFFPSVKLCNFPMIVKRLLK